MCDLFFAYTDPKPLKQKDSKLILNLFMADLPVFNTEDFNSIYDLFMGDISNKEKFANAFKKSISKKITKSSEHKNLSTKNSRLMCDLFFDYGVTPKM